MSYADTSTSLFAFREPLFFFGGAALSGLLFIGVSPQVGIFFTQIILGAGILRSSWKIIQDLRQGRGGVDMIALLAMIVSVWLSQWLAGIVILLMLTGGESLEQYASQRARRHLTALLNGMPTTAHRKVMGRLRDLPVEDVRVGDVLVIKPGESVPVDGIIIKGQSTIDESRITGEPLSIDKGPHDRVLGGSVNQVGLLEIRATAVSAQSQYQRIVALVRAAEEQRAPFVRMADRFSIVFTVLTFAIATIAWMLSGDPLRVLAVLVVATPCPLILATPIAMLSGMSRAAKRGIIVRSGGALETLAHAGAFVFDKTGTLTFGTPSIKAIIAEKGYTEAEILRIAASLDQASSHVLARALVAFAHARQVVLAFPQRFVESIGKGVVGVIERKRFYFGRASYLHEHGIRISVQASALAEKRKLQGERTVFVSDAKQVIGMVVFSDTLRPGLKPFFQALTKEGAKKIQMLTGDKKTIADRIARTIGIHTMRAECLPEEKEEEIRKLRKRYTVVMVGDGVNDAPALATASVGIAMGANGSAVASESADIIMTVDEVTLVKDAFQIAKYTILIAKEGIGIGIGLSALLMVIASTGVLPPVYGAFLQEAVDVIVILHALRAA